MSDLKDGESTEMKGSGKNPYVLKNTGGVYSCSCPAWRNQSTPIDKRSCKHLVKLRGREAEELRVATTISGPVKPTSEKDAPPLLLAHSWDGSQDVTGWWMSEKLDGVRAYWDGNKFLSRLGNEFYAPDWFKYGLPSDQTLDGELWIGRKKFQETSGIVRRHDGGDLWKKICFMVFDVPSMEAPFEDRMAAIDSEIERAEHAVSVLTGIAESNDHVLIYLKTIEADGGEGLMLRQPGSLYEAGRSHTLLKVKSFKDDDATVTGYTKGKGKHKGKIGALEVVLTDGTKFEIGTGLSDAERADPPKVGSTVKFRYQELTDGGVPRFPSYIGVRDE